MDSSTPHPDRTPKPRFVPHGVDAGSWLGFEQRIQERRFRALVETARGALAARDRAAARSALAEARTIHPDADELTDLERTLATQTTAERRRMPGAAALLAAGVALLFAVDALRAPRSAPETTEVIAETMDTSAPAPYDSVATTGVLSDAIAAVSIDQPIQRAISRTPVDEPAPRPRMFELDNPPTPARMRTVELSPRVRPVELQSDSARETAPAAFNVVAPRPVIVEPPPVPVIAAPAEAAAAPLTAPAAAADESLVTSALRRYARAYSALDARAARDVWPSVDERALSNAFAGLKAQSLDFQDCEVVVRVAEADAVCRGTARYVPLVGNSSPRIEPRTWHFELSRQGDEWLIDTAVAGR